MMMMVVVVTRVVVETNLRRGENEIEGKRNKRADGGLRR